MEAENEKLISGATEENQESDALPLYSRTRVRKTALFLGVALSVVLVGAALYSSWPSSQRSMTKGKAGPISLQEINQAVDVNWRTNQGVDVRCHFDDDNPVTTKNQFTLKECELEAENLQMSYISYNPDVSGGRCRITAFCKNTITDKGTKIYTKFPPVIEIKPATRKKGYSGIPGDAEEKCSDAQTLGLGDSWYYNWMAIDSKNSRCYNSMNYVASEFVPIMQKCSTVNQVWDGEKVVEPYASSWKELGVRFILGYNEPDGHVIPCGPTEAAKQWVKVQKIAEWFDPPLRLVSPAMVSGPNSDGTGGFVNGKSAWLDNFFQECDNTPGCDTEKIEFFNFHDYEGAVSPLIPETGAFSRTDNLQRRIEQGAQNYAFKNGTKRKVWLTEINVGCGLSGVCRNCTMQKELKTYRNGQCNWPSTLQVALQYEDQLKYMKDAITFMESSDLVYRYTWFAARKVPGTFNGYSDLITWDSAGSPLTPLGEYWKNAPENQPTPPNQPNPTPPPATPTPPTTPPSNDGGHTYEDLHSSECCKPIHRVDGWGNLAAFEDLAGNDVDTECQDLCSAQASCLYVSLKKSQGCTSYESCDEKTSCGGFKTWKKISA